MSTSLVAGHALRRTLGAIYTENEGIFFTGSGAGYWSNLNPSANAQLMDAITTTSCATAIQAGHPELANVIFSPKRAAGLELLELSGSEVCADFGCMWGALALPLAKRCKYVVGFDQTLDSLRFSKKRATEEDVRNIDFVCGDLRSSTFPEEFFDIAVVNGVLEWIPERGDIDLTSYYGKFVKKCINSRPREEQLDFLRAVRASLKEDGKLYLAIENRYDYKMFFGVPDPHSGIPFTSIVPRWIATAISSMRLGRQYVNYTFSFSGLTKLIREAGLSSVDLYMCWPDYRFPERIVPYGAGGAKFRSLISARNNEGRFRVRRAVAKMVETVAFGRARAWFLAPSIVCVAHK